MHRAVSNRTLQSGPHAQDTNNVSFRGRCQSRSDRKLLDRSRFLPSNSSTIDDNLVSHVGDGVAPVGATGHSGIPAMNAQHRTETRPFPADAAVPVVIAKTCCLLRPGSH